MTSLSIADGARLAQEAAALLSTQQAAQILRVTSSRVVQLADAGTLRPLVTPIGRLYRRADVEALAAERRRNPPRPGRRPQRSA